MSNFSRLKVIVLFVLVIASMFVIPVNAQTTAQFGYQLHPEKLLENTEGTLQIFVTSNEMMVPRSIDNLKVISSDNSILQVVDVQKNNDGYTKNVKIKAVKPGVANIALAAPGFSSKEIKLEVFNNNNHPTQILMKITPNDFSIDGPRFGYVTVELATTGGLPTVASEDTIITIDTPNKDTVSLRNNELIIKKGEYFATTEFDVKKSGDVIVFASAENMKKISQFIHIRKATEPLQVQLFVIPNKFNSYSGGKGYAVVELLDAAGTPVKAEEDIYMKLGVESQDTSVNKSHSFEEVQFNNKELVIKKGEYSTYTTFSPRPNLGDFARDTEKTFNMFISTDNYLTKGDSFTVANVETGALEGEGPSFTKVLPFLTTGNKEIIAVTYFQADVEVSRKTGTSTQGVSDRTLSTVTLPVTAKKDYEINFASSKSTTVNPINPIMKKGENVVIVFGNTGTNVPDDPVLFYITDNEGVKTVTANPQGPKKDEITLTVEPLVSVVLAGKEFPAIAYLVKTGDESRAGAIPFTEDSVLTLTANDFAHVDNQIIKKNQPYALFPVFTTEIGSTTLEFQVSQFKGSMGITSYTADPAKIHLSFAKNLLSNNESLATIQLLNSAGNPVYSKDDVIIKIVSNDESILQIPDEIIIKKGEYFNTFKLKSQNDGQIELALLSEDLPLTTYSINIVDLTPAVSMELHGGMTWNERVEAIVSVTIPEIDTSLDGFNVEWTSVGGEVLQMDNVTNNKGIAKMNVLANDKDTVTVSVTVSGNGLSPSTISKTVEILNRPVNEISTNTENDLSLNSNIIYIVIPIAIGVAIFILKRTEKFAVITEKFGEVKEKISSIKDR